MTLDLACSVVTEIGVQVYSIRWVIIIMSSDEGIGLTEEGVLLQGSSAGQHL